MRSYPVLILSQSTLTQVSSLRKVHAITQARRLMPVMAGVGEAQKWLDQNRYEFSAILIGEEHAEEFGQWLEWIHVHHVGTPVFVIAEKIQPGSAQALLWASMGIRQVCSLEAALSSLSPHVMPNAAMRNSASGGTVKLTADEGFFGISARHFVFPVTATFDIFVRIRANSYIKVLHLGDRFDASRLSRYLEKGLTHFYVRSDAIEAYLALCRAQARKMRLQQVLPGAAGMPRADGKAPKPSMVDRLARQLHLGDVVIQVLQSSGVDSRVIQSAREFCDGLRAQMETGRFSQKTGIADFIESLSAYEHGVASAMVVHLFFKGLHIESPHIQQSLGMAALLHDIGRKQGVPEHEDIEHPLRSAALMEKIGGIEPIAIRAVRQHHESRDGKGYPRRLASGQIHLFGELLSIADEIVTRISNGSQEAISEVQSLSSRKYSYQIVAAFQKVFNRGELQPGRIPSAVESAKRYLSWGR